MATVLSRISAQMTTLRRRQMARFVTDCTWDGWLPNAASRRVSHAAAGQRQRIKRLSRLATNEDTSKFLPAALCPINQCAKPSSPPAARLRSPKQILRVDPPEVQYETQKLSSCNCSHAYYLHFWTSSGEGRKSPLASNQCGSSSNKRRG